MMKKVLESLVRYAALTLVMYVFIQGAFYAWDKEYEIERERIAEYRALEKNAKENY